MNNMILINKLPNGRSWHQTLITGGEDRGTQSYSADSGVRTISFWINSLDLAEYIAPMVGFSMGNDVMSGGQGRPALRTWTLLVHVAE